MLNRLKYFIAVIFMWASCAHAAFVPEQPIISLSDLKPGMSGYMLTVLRGSEPERIPVRIISISPNKPGTDVRAEILIRLEGRQKLAQGMSGSPVYIQGKLAGAVRSGWEFSDQTMAFAAPIEDMCRIFTTEDTKADGAIMGAEDTHRAFTPAGGTLRDNLNMSAVTLSGLKVSANSSITKLAQTLGITFTQGTSMTGGTLTTQQAKFRPGEAVSALMAWGDVEMGAVGTVTATAKDGRFLAFGHPFMKKGPSSYPAARTFIHETINSTMFPFKLASPTGITGTFTQDREAGLGGRTGYFAQSIPAELTFRDIDNETQTRYKFRVIADEFMSAKLIGGIYAGLAEEAWGRKGAGTMNVTLRIDAPGVPDGWTRRDIFFSDEDIAANAFNQTAEIIDAFLTQPFAEVMPAGFAVTVEATQKPRALVIEDIDAPSHARPGEKITVKVKLRGWRTKPVSRTFTMTVPEDASGISELIVRGGSLHSMSQLAIEEGLKSIDSLKRMLTEIKALDSGYELIAELNSDTFDEELEKILSNKKQQKQPAHESDFLPEEEEYLSETKERRLKEGTLRIFTSDYFIDGIMRRIIHVEK